MPKKKETVRRKRPSGSQRREAIGKVILKPMDEKARKLAFERLAGTNLPDFVKEGLRRRFIQRPQASMVEFNSWVGIFNSLLTKTGMARSLEEFMEQEFKRRKHLKSAEVMTYGELKDEVRKLKENKYLTPDDKKAIKAYWRKQKGKLNATEAHLVSHYFVGLRWYNQMLERRKVKPPKIENGDKA